MKKILINKKFKDIQSIYNISKITNEFIQININKLIKKVYIYEIDPVVMLNCSNDTKQNTLNIYLEFLREFNLDFQILILNEKMNINKYLDEYTNNLDIIENHKLIEIYTKYINDIKQKLINENIYTTKYYIIIAIRETNNLNINNVDKSIFKLNKIGCNVKRIHGIENYKNILYECINKENLI